MNLGLNRTLVVLFFVSCTFRTLGQVPVVIHANFTELNPAQQFLVAEDPTKDMNWQVTRTLDFESVKQREPNFGFVNSSFWFKGTLVNAAGMTTSAFLSIEHANLDVVQFFLFQDSLLVGQFSSGDTYPFAHRPLDNKYFQYPIQLAAYDTIQVLVNVQNSGEQFHVPIHLLSAKKQRENDELETVFFSLYFGFILFVILINVFYSFVLKDRSAKYYVGYLIGLLALQLSLSGMGYKYMWSDSIFLANRGNPIFSSFSVALLLLFVQEFLKLKEFLPRMYRFFQVSFWMLMVAFVFSFLPGNFFFQVAVIVINVLTLIMAVAFLPISIYVLKQDFKPARYFIGAFSMLLIFVVLFVLKNAGVMPSGFFTNFGMQIGSAFEVLLLTLALIDKFNRFQNQALESLQAINQLKSETNLMLEIKVAERTSQLSEQGKILAFQNQEIVSSIQYAKRIQSAVFHSTHYLKQTLGEHAWALLLPKDVVSGDFYFVLPSAFNQNQVYVAVVDCTGHGVPGGFMSMLGLNFLKQSIRENEKDGVGAILMDLNARLLRNFNRTDDYHEQFRDGMDIALICLNRSTGILEYAGANNGLYLVSEMHELQVVKPDKKSMGSSFEPSFQFTKRRFQLQEGTWICLFSDGFKDQFGGENNKKMGTSKFQTMLLDTLKMPMGEQQASLLKGFNAWRGDLEQTDDVCVLCIRYTKDTQSSK